MTDFATELTVDQNNPVLVEQIEERSSSFRYLIAMALILLGGIVTIAWIAFLGWNAGRLFSLW